VTPQKLRALVFERDHGQCALCPADTEAVRIGYEGALAAARERHAKVMEAETGWRVLVSGQKMMSEIRTIRSRLNDLGFITGQALWQMDHALSLVEGGKNDLDNLRTLCTRCHAKVTAELKGRLSRRLGKRVAIRGEDRQSRPVWR
jgi:hypothetical protein